MHVLNIRFTGATDTIQISHSSSNHPDIQSYMGISLLPTERKFSKGFEKDLILN